MEWLTMGHLQGYPACCTAECLPYLAWASSCLAEPCSISNSGGQAPPSKRRHWLAAASVTASLCLGLTCLEMPSAGSSQLTSCKRATSRTAAS